jgi:hypothetical protein
MLIHHKTNKRNIPEIDIKVDLAVVGGGLSGVCCAIMAARKGIKVALIQDRPILGGNASSEIRVWALGATSHMGNNNRWAREGGLIDEILVENMHRNKEGNPLLFDTVLLDKVLAEPNITLLLNTAVFDVFKDGEKKISSLLAFNPQNCTTYSIEASLYTDASGDGIVGYIAGASYRFGAEESEEFGEGFSPSDKYGNLLGHTIFLYPKITDKKVVYTAPDFAIKDMKAIPKLNQINPNQTGCNYWWFEYGGKLNTVSDTEQIKYELWKIVYGAWNYIKNSGLFPEAEKMTLEWVGMIPGKRESRRFQGEYILTQQDIVQQRTFDDAIAYGGWAIDLHPAEGVYSSLPSCNQYHSKGIYSIPYRCYVSKDIDNLFMIGRLISVTHVAFGSTRVMITCALGGQAIGTAAALCIQQHCAPIDLLEEQKMRQLQDILNGDGQSIPHLRLSQKDNLANDATLKADSTLLLGGLPKSDEWQTLDSSRAMLLPLKAHTAYTFQFYLSASCDTEMTVEWRVASRAFNYTPDTLVDSKTISVAQGEQVLPLAFDKTIDTDQYSFIIFRRNENIQILLSDDRVTGILSVSNHFNLAVNNRGVQTPPSNSGFESFEFFTPERRPGGKNFAFKITPPIDCFGPENLTNGFLRPYLQPNAWVCELDKEIAHITWTWDKQQEIHSIRLYFDTDADHPMETIQWNHPENVMPFCVSHFAIYDEKDNCLFAAEDNYKTIRHIEFSQPVRTRSIRMELHQHKENIPIALYEVEIR